MGIAGRRIEFGLRGGLRTLVLTVVLFVAAAHAESDRGNDNSGMGILEIRSQAVGQSLRLTMPMLIPGDISRGWQAFGGLTWTNVWANDDAFVLDYEMLDTLIGVGYGFTDRWGAAAVLDDRSYFGGAMDSFIESFHNVFGIDQDGRDSTGRGRNTVSRKDPSTGRDAVMSARDMNNTGLSLLLNCNIIEGAAPWPSVNLYGVARYALSPAKVFVKTGAVDGGLGVGLAKRWFKRWYTYGVLGYTVYAERGQTAIGDVVLEDRQFSGLAAVSWQYAPDLALIAQYLYSSAGIKNIASLDQPSHEVHLGFKWRLGPVYTFEAALIENIITMDNSPDFGLHAGVGLHF